MKLNLKISVFCFFLLFATHSFAQWNAYHYKRSLSSVTEQWHKIYLADEIFGKIRPDLSDIRILGVNKKKDTIEIPYILKVLRESFSSQEVTFKLINQSHNKSGYYFTFETGDSNSVNEIQLAFKQKNFDWKVMLEGSQNQDSWFTILDDYRILSINNSLTDFQFTKINFPSSRYRYFRILVKSEVQPELIETKISLNKRAGGEVRNYSVASQKIIIDKKQKQTVMDIELNLPEPVSIVKIGVHNSADYYRPFTISYVSDSFKTAQGWKYNYESLFTGTLNSIEKNEFKFNNTILQNMQIVIDNQDNQPLSIDSVKVSGYVYELIARFNEPGDYYLVYGNINAVKPEYDINRFMDKIPLDLTALSLNQEQLINKENITPQPSLFQNKKWLWFVMSAIILILGWFTISMMRKK